MKKTKKIVSLVLTLVVFLMALCPVMASEMEGEPFTEPERVLAMVNIKANVPQGFSEKIAFILKDDEIAKQYPLALTPENGYSGTLGVEGNKTYVVMAVFQNEIYGTDLAGTCNIKGAEASIEFNVRKLSSNEVVYDGVFDNDVNYYNQNNMMTVNETSSENNNNSSESNTGNNNEKNGTSKEETDPVTGLLTPESAYQRFLEKVAFMEEDANFDSFTKFYSGDGSKKYFLEADSMNTEEQWDSMSNFERFFYTFSFRQPNFYLKKYNYSSVDDWINELEATKRILSDIEKGDAVYEAIVELWKWHYDYFKSTGTVYNFFNAQFNTGKKDVPKESKEEIKDSEQKEMEELAKELEEEIKKEEKKVKKEKKKNNAVVAYIKKNPFTCVFLVVAAIAFLGIHLYNRKKNVMDTSDEKK